MYPCKVSTSWFTNGVKLTSIIEKKNLLQMLRILFLQDTSMSGWTWKQVWAFTFQDDPELRARRCSRYIWRVSHFAEVGSVVAELSRTQQYRDVPLVDVSNKLHSVFELLLSMESPPVAEVENLQQGKVPVWSRGLTQLRCCSIITQSS